MCVAAANASERDLLLSQVHRGDLHILDRGYPALNFFRQLSDRGAFFVTRLSRSWKPLSIKVLPLTPDDSRYGILSDTVALVGQGLDAFTLRVVTFQDARGHSYRFATNLFTLSATEIADLYRERWRVEILFRFVKRFVGSRLTLRHRRACDARLLTVFMAAVLLLILFPQLGSSTFAEPNVRWLRRVRAALEQMGSG